MRTLFLLVAAALVAVPAFAGHHSGFEMTVLVDDGPLPEFRHQGSVYVEALRGSDFAIRLTNPMPYRVAVALAVDGLNTIDAKHTDPWKASKWVLEPYESAVISGWQVSGSTARRFFFTGERRSYGAKLGQTDNLGVIEAVVYRERPRQVYNEPCCDYDAEPRMRQESSKERAQAPAAAGSAAPAPKEQGLSDDYAATGMGRRERHRVERVSIDLDPSPLASFRVRYEFRPQLVKLGVLPAHPTPLERRERARGFGNWCPEPN